MIFAYGIKVEVSVKSQEVETVYSSVKNNINDDANTIDTSDDDNEVSDNTDSKIRDILFCSGRRTIVVLHSPFSSFAMFLRCHIFFFFP